jgi:hypothetical protein
MHATDLVGINGITRVLLVYTCQQGIYLRGHVLPLRLPNTGYSVLKRATTFHFLFTVHIHRHRRLHVASVSWVILITQICC